MPGRLCDAASDVCCWCQMTALPLRDVMCDVISCCFITLPRFFCRHSAPKSMNPKHSQVAALSLCLSASRSADNYYTQTVDQSFVSISCVYTCIGGVVSVEHVEQLSLYPGFLQTTFPNHANMSLLLFPLGIKIDIPSLKCFHAVAFSEPS